MALMRALFVAPVALLVAEFTIGTPVRAQTPTAADSGVVVGIITTTLSGEPLPFADVTIESTRRGTFADSLGRFRLAALPLGTLQLRARRLGYAPLVLTLTVSGRATDTIRISLTPISLKLEAVRTRASSVCGSSRRDADTVVVAILDQVRANAERSRLLAREYPFEATIERTIGERSGRRESTHHVDTLTRLGGDEREWRYQPGALVRPARDTGFGATERMMIPELVDFADETFIGAHCFQFAGVATVDGQRLVRLSFEPSKSINGPDVSGSLYLSPDSYQLRRSTLRLERMSPFTAGLQVVDVESTFRDIVPFVPVLDVLTSTTGTRSFTGMTDSRVALERQRLLDVRYLRDAP